MNNFIYDIESYPNVFIMVIRHHETGLYYCFEISERKNEIDKLYQMIRYIQAQPGSRMVGYNNLSFDYPMLHFILDQYHATALDIYNLCDRIIHAGNDNKFTFMIWDDQQHVPQLDLLKIHHFDNVAKFTSLKVLEYNMRSSNIQDLPFAPGTYLTSDQIDELIFYNKHDVDETEKFFLKSMPMIEFREYLSEKYNRNFLNHNDTKIGKDFFIMKLEESCPGICYEKIMGRRQPRQTPRESIAFKDVIFPYVRFDHPEFNRILDWFNATTIAETKESITNLTCKIDGFEFVFGTGGIHGSVESTTIHATEEDCILDLDVTSFYPKLGISNRVYPAHLGDLFCDIYEELFNQRAEYEKGTPENGMLKLALNGTYGDSNNRYSPFYDPKYTMTITINGQLLLCMLAEQLMKIPGLQMIQVNTDGLTVKCNRKWLDHIGQVRKWWCGITRLELEEAFYRRFFVRDVNNYIAEYDDGKVKRKGAYEHKRQWHQNQSSLIIPMAAEHVLLNGGSAEDFIRNHEDKMDFMLRTKVPRSSRLVLESGDRVTPLQNITRYYVSKTGGSLIKIMKPLKGKTVDRRIGINVGWLVSECNDIGNFNPDDINYDYYIQEAKKLIEPLRG